MLTAQTAVIHGLVVPTESIETMHVVWCGTRSSRVQPGADDSCVESSVVSDLQHVSTLEKHKRTTRAKRSCGCITTLHRRSLSGIAEGAAGM